MILSFVFLNNLFNPIIIIISLISIMNKFQLLDKYSPSTLVCACNSLPLLNQQKQLALKQIGQSLHLRSASQGYQIEYINNKKQRLCTHQQTLPYCKYRIQTIFLYLHNKKNGQYKHSLVYALSNNSTIKSSTMLLGQPITKSKYCIECIWDNLGVGIVYIGDSWNNQDLLIDYIYIYRPHPKYQNIKVCSYCKKEQQNNHEFECKTCLIISYCSADCYQKHWMHHKTYCQEVD